MHLARRPRCDETVAKSRQFPLSEISCIADDPSADYWVVREELRLYNPSYCTKPHVVALNKMDLEDAYEVETELVSDLTAMAERLQVCLMGIIGSSLEPASAPLHLKLPLVIETPNCKGFPDIFSCTHE